MFYGKINVIAWYVLAGILITFVSCAKVPFTKEIQSQHNLSDQQLKKIQFYSSQTFYLNRGYKMNEDEISGSGKLKSVNNRSIEEIKVKKGTKCLIDKVIDSTKVAVVFEKGDGKFLLFGDSLNDKGKYSFIPEEWIQNRGKVLYGKQYYITSLGTDSLHLTIRMKSINKVKRKTRKVKGRKLK